MLKRRPLSSRQILVFGLVTAASFVVASCQQSGPLHEAQARRSTVSGYNVAFDFAPPERLADRLPAVDALTPLERYAATLRPRLGAPSTKVPCNWVAGETFPPPRQGLIGYLDQDAFLFAGQHKPNDANRWFDQFAFYSKRAAAHLLARPAGAAGPAFGAALRDYARTGAALDLARFVDASTGSPVATPDIASAVNNTTAITVSYLLVRDRLGLPAAERRDIELWLGALHDTFADGYRRWRPGSEADLRRRWLLGAADMARGLLENDAVQFNRGAREAMVFIEQTRTDGSHRFGAARGYRALYYQGVSLNAAMDAYILLASQGLPAEALILPTAERMGAFWARAWEDHSVLDPYAQENEGAPPGSNHRRQDRIEVAAGIDLLIAASPVAPMRGALRSIRATHPYPTNYSEMFNTTCIAAALSGPQ